MDAKAILCVSAIFLVFSSAHAGGRNGQLEEEVESEVANNWRVAFDSKQSSYLLTSPIYALEYDEGCVMYRQAFPEIDGKVAYARMDFYKLYFANAAGSECFEISPDRFFSPEEGTEPYGALDFIRYVFEGPKSGRDTVKDADVTRLKKCFSLPARNATDVVYAQSRPLPGSAALKYTVAFRCSELGAAEEAFVSGETGKGVLWEIRSSVPIDVHK